MCSLGATISVQCNRSYACRDNPAAGPAASGAAQPSCQDEHIPGPGVHSADRPPPGPGDSGGHAAGVHAGAAAPAMAQPPCAHGHGCWQWGHRVLVDPGSPQVKALGTLLVMIIMPSTEQLLMPLWLTASQAFISSEPFYSDATPGSLRSDASVALRLRLPQAHLSHVLLQSSMQVNSASWCCSRVLQGLPSLDQACIGAAKCRRPSLP